MSDDDFASPQMPPNQHWLEKASGKKRLVRFPDEQYVVEVKKAQAGSDDEEDDECSFMFNPGGGSAP